MRQAICKSLLFALLCAIPWSTARAHVKWFSEFDLNLPPLNINEVLDGRFIRFYVLTVILVYMLFWLDRYLYRRQFLVQFLDGIVITESMAEVILRVTAFVFFASLFGFGLSDSLFYITPELKADNSIILWLHFVAMLCVLHRFTVPLTGCLMIVLFIFAAVDYGVFHSIDYLIFLGLAYYFVFSRATSATWKTTRYVVLFATLGLNLCWLAIEKWAFPHWTYPLLEQYPHLLLGLEPDTYMVFAGFVEFTIAFVLLSAASSFSRIIALGFAVIFILGIYQFGIIDAVGHLFVLAILSILVLRGPTNARYFLVLSNKSLWAEAYFMTGLYTLAFTLVFIAYYSFYTLLHTTSG